jgi:hypothetical protein
LLFVFYYQVQKFACRKIPQKYDSGRNHLAEHVIEMHRIGKKVYQSGIEKQSDKADKSVYQKFYPAIAEFGDENEFLAQQVVYRQSDNE